MTVEYAWRGIVGVLTPQANTTVEPEFAILMPPGAATITARMVSPAPSVEERLRDYFDTLATACSQFANAPLGAVAVACTGASYLAGYGRETALIAAAQAAVGVPVLTSARCVLDALRVLGARQIGLVSPYGAALTQASVAYWEGAGHSVARVVDVAANGGGFHPIYTVQTGDVVAALDQLGEGRGYDAVLILGTGLPSLPAILERPRVGGAPVLSCTLATAWRCVRVLDGAPAEREALLEWIGGAEWGGRLRARQRHGTA